MELKSASIGFPLLADAAYGNHMAGWGWGWMIGGWLVVILAAGLIAWLLQGARRPAGSQRTPADEVLAERFARGEIDATEYEERLSVLRR